MKDNLSIINVMESPFFDRPTGAARLACDLSYQQVKWGYRVFIVAIKTSPDLPDQEERGGITVMRVPDTAYTPPDPRNLLDKTRNTGNAVKKILSEFGQVDVIHSHTPMQGLGALAAVSGKPTLRIHSIHSPWLMEMRAGKNWEGRGNLRGRILSRAAFAVAKQVEAGCFRRTDFLTSDSRYTKEEIIKEHGRKVKKKRFEVLPGWVDTNRFTPEGPRTNWRAELGRLSRGPVFFTIRGLGPRYGLEMLVDSAGLLKKSGLEFEVVIGGTGPLRSTILSQIHDLSLEDRVTLIGQVEDEKLPILYRSCDVFVLPTLALECFGIIILEALASGKPVIATPVGAIPELMKPIFPEGLLPETSAQALADTMTRYIRATENGRQMGDQPDKFREYVCNHYSIDVGTNRFKELYESPIITKGR